MTASLVASPPAPAVASSPLRPCGGCLGTGETSFSAFTAADGTHYPAFRRVCHSCDGDRFVGPVDTAAVLAAILTRGALRKSPPTGDRRTLAGSRAYYVWRLARFHGGEDVTLPMAAFSGRAGKDPYREALDQLADAVAMAAFGTDRAGAYRWGSLLSSQAPLPPAGLPSSAYPSGPVVLGEKPVEEYPELFSEDELAELDVEALRSAHP